MLVPGDTSEKSSAFRSPDSPRDTTLPRYPVWSVVPSFELHSCPIVSEMVAGWNDVRDSAIIGYQEGYR
jgi:hypothetical protein